MSAIASRARRMLVLFAIVSSTAAFAQSTTEVGGDRFSTGASAVTDAPGGRDVFVTGFSAEMRHDAAGDAHLAGFTVELDAQVGRDAFAGGARIVVDAPVGEDLTAVGFSVETEPSARIGGNLRVVAGSAVLRAPVSGSAVVTAGDVELDAPISGDLLLSAGGVTFGPNARVGGTIRHLTPQDTVVPAFVAEPGRVTAIGPAAVAGAAGEAAGASASSDDDEGGGWLIGTAALLIVLFISGAILLGLFPALIERQRLPMLARPGRTLLLGLLGLSVLVGLVPVGAMTLIGVAIVPAVLLAIVLAWWFGYLLGAYTLARRVLGGLVPIGDGTGARLTALAVGLVVFTILNWIPVLGWLVNIGVVLFGLGGLTRAALRAVLARAA